MSFSDQPAEGFSGTPREQMLEEARRRGREVMGTNALPAAMDNVTTYVGLISSALELGKLIATEERDLKAIETHHQREVMKISSAFSETELAMRADFERDKTMRDESFKAIHSLIAAGQHEIAMRFYEILQSNFSRPALEVILTARNATASPNTRLTLK